MLYVNILLMAKPMVDPRDFYGVTHRFLGNVDQSHHRGAPLRLVVAVLCAEAAVRAAAAVLLLGAGGVHKPTNITGGSHIV